MKVKIVDISSPFNIPGDPVTYTNVQVDFGVFQADITVPENSTVQEIETAANDYYHIHGVSEPHPLAETEITLSGVVELYIYNTTIWERMTEAEKQLLFEYSGPGAWLRDAFLHDLELYCTQVFDAGHRKIKKDNMRLNYYFDQMIAVGIIADAARKAEILA